MKNTIDNADYTINLHFLFDINQYLTKSCYSHSMVAGGLEEIS